MRASGKCPAGMHRQDGVYRLLDKTGKTGNFGEHDAVCVSHFSLDKSNMLGSGLRYERLPGACEVIDDKPATFYPLGNLEVIGVKSGTVGS